jgi:hypothetical protein
MVAGIRGVEWDAVELPSQFMENWWVACVGGPRRAWAGPRAARRRRVAFSWTTLALV